ncbi:hypothetical protein IJJ18_01915 [Candidatus Saccharibacteria bacterium]|nr:hypothetical protein [Candidatus Saccharibacteria bacterium]
MVKNEKEGLYGEAENTKVQNIRFIVTTALVALVVLGIATWGIIYAVGGSRNAEEGENQPAETTQAAENTATDESAGDDVVEVTDLKGESTAETKTETETEANTVATSSENIPKTGPEGIIPIALLLGAMTTFAGSVKLAKSEA